MLKRLFWLILHTSWLSGIFATAIAAPIYQYTGQFGEMVYSQTPPIDKPYQAISVLHSTTKSDKMHQDCQKLKGHLTTLNAGGVIHEIDASGNKTQLSPAQVSERQAQIRDALTQYCHD